MPTAYFHPTYGERTKVLALYNAGKSAAAIQEKLNLPVSVRSIQRYVAKNGIARGPRVSQELAKDRHRKAITRYWRNIKRLITADEAEQMKRFVLEKSADRPRVGERTREWEMSADNIQ